jgi:hypothetical protein
MGGLLAISQEVTRLCADAPAGLTIRAAAILWGRVEARRHDGWRAGSCPVGQTLDDPRRLSPRLSAGRVNVDRARDKEPIVPPIPDAPLTDGRAAV